MQITIENTEKGNLKPHFMTGFDKLSLYILHKNAYSCKVIDVIITLISSIIGNICSLFAAKL